jgi:hypothetical protein
MLPAPQKNAARSKSIMAPAIVTRAADRCPPSKEPKRGAMEAAIGISS